MKAKVPFSWPGGKSNLVPYLLPLIPTHNTYVEVFGGCGSLLFNKPRSNVEVYNDIYDVVVNFFRVLRGDRKDELIEQLILTLFSRSEYMLAREVVHNCEHDEVDPVELARCFYVSVMQSFSSLGGNIVTGWATEIENSSCCARWFRKIAWLDWFHYRLKNVSIECQTFENIIPFYDTPGTFFYLDPPYMPETRYGTGNKGYKHEMSTEDHERLIALCKGVKGMILLSGYACPLYDMLVVENNWVKYVIKSCATMANTSHSDIRLKPKREECIYLNPLAYQNNPQMRLF